MQYLGGKARIAKEMVKIIESVRLPDQTYVEPFLGGCNVLPLMSGERIGSDINKDIIEFYQALKQGWIPPTHITESEYNQLKKESETSALRGFAGMACAYGGRWFSGYARNSSGRNYTLNGHNSAMKLAPKLKDATLVSTSYSELEIPDKSLVYCDPPYKGTAGYKFDHDLFYQWVQNLAQAGHTILVSEYNLPVPSEVIWEKVRNLEIRRNKLRTEKRVEKLFKIIP